jgi:glutaredoxin
MTAHRMTPRRLFICLPLLLATCPASARDEAATPRVTVYGRDSCGYTRSTVVALDVANVPFRYLRTTEPAVRRALFAKMDAAGIPDGPFKLPVVEIDGILSMRPSVDDMLERAGAAPRRNAATP